ncbi:MAG TPA: DNA topoisomerase [Blastocatellia bacterium]|nr:DNA topoisomerase [Blastocatellia bacterium]
MTGIERLQRNGIIRTGTSRRGFRYTRVDGKRLLSSDLARITKLRIPPAWTNVAVSLSPGSKLQAVGRDTAGRWQYLYHENHSKSRENIKYRRLIHFIEDLPRMRLTVARHLRQPGLGRETILACITRVLSTCFLRPGSEVYASENGSYGIATLKPQHVSVQGDLVRFDFPGKSGVRQYRELRDRQVARVLNKLLNCRKTEVFKYQSTDGLFVDIKRRHINEYIKEVMGESFSAKDFRTWAGTVVCACALAHLGTDNFEQSASRKRKIAGAIKTTAQALGNTPSVCRSSYICPAVIESFEKGEIIEYHFNTPEEFVAYRGAKLHPAEAALLKLLKRT